VNHHFSQVNNTKLCYYYFTIDSRKSDTNIANLAQVKQELRSITRPWENSLNDLLLKEYGKTKGREKYLEFSEAFPIAYKEDNIYSSVIIRDIENISSVIERKKVIFKDD
jgi:NAD-specific glutamate dehydrogenase